MFFNVFVRFPGQTILSDIYILSVYLNFISSFCGFAFFGCDSCFSFCSRRYQELAHGGTCVALNARKRAGAEVEAS